MSKQAKILIKQSRSHFENGNARNALVLLQKAKGMVEDNTLLKAIIYLDTAKICVELNHEEKAKQYVKKALVTDKSISTQASKWLSSLTGQGKEQFVKDLRRIKLLSDKQQEKPKSPPPPAPEVFEDYEDYEEPMSLAPDPDDFEETSDTTSCDNCGSIIGRLERSVVHNGNTLCTACDQRINRPKTRPRSVAINLRELNVDAPFVLGILGSILLIAGVFAPIIKVAHLGSVSYYQNGKGDGVAIIILAAVSILIVIIRQFPFLWLTGLGSLGTLIYTFVRFQMKLNKLGKQLSASPFGRSRRGGFLDALQLDWGWIVLIAGAVLIIAAVAIDRKNA